MALGPILIFDKSTLQSLSADEAVWLDNFYMCNITPLFFIETLADLEKAVRAGRAPEQVVGELAYKTPDMGSRPNAHHGSLIASELLGGTAVEMRGVPVIAGGQPVTLEGQTGIVFHESPEEEAFNRWQRGEFLEIERQIAKEWRRALSNMDWDTYYQRFQRFFIDGHKPKTLAQVKTLAERIIESPDQEYVLAFGLKVLGVSREWSEQVVARWRSAGFPSVRNFAPYFTYVLSVDLFFYLGIAADLISRERRSHRIDVAYLYYLPFCMAFTSSDKFHASIAPLFLKPEQSFINGSDLKADLRRLDEHYSRLPDEVKDGGLFGFAAYPPADTSFLVTQLWDKHLPRWRKHQDEAAHREPISKEAQEALLQLVKRFQKESTPLDSARPIPPEDVAQMTITRRVHIKKGKWKRFPPSVKPDE